MMSAGEQGTRRLETRRSTERKPYHYVGAGLPNVYLIGVEYRVDKETGQQSADIPCLSGLLEALARALLEKQAPLSADELRFLRKRLRVASKDFAAMVGVTSEQYSRIENGAQVTPTVDRLVRFLYVALARLTPDVADGVAKVRWEAEVNREAQILATRDAEDHWSVRTRAA